MKFEIDGNIIECTVEEYKELRILSNVKKKEEKEVVIIKEKETIPDIDKIQPNIKPRTYKLDWDSIYKKCRSLISKSDVPVSVLELINHVSIGVGSSSYNNINDMFTKVYGIRKVKGGYIHTSKIDAWKISKEKKKDRKIREIPIKIRDTPIKVIERSTFVFSRANNLMKNDTRMTREKAFSIASNEWNLKKGIVPIGTKLNKKKSFTVIDNFPYIKPITKDSQSVLCSMIKNMIGSDEKKLSYLDVKHHLMTDLGEWNGKIWIKFLYNISIKSKAILSYFSISGKLFIDKDSTNHHILRYRR